MYKIIKAEKLNEIVYLMVVEAPMVAKHCQPGQFIIVKEDDAGERIPLTICDRSQSCRRLRCLCGCQEGRYHHQVYIQRNYNEKR